jgi:hypothetical protein
MAINNKAMLEAFSRDRALACETVFRHRHVDETPGFHVSMHDAWRSADEFVLITAFREAGKSTTAEEFITLEACFQNFGYLILGGETYTKACQRLESIKYELSTNMKIYNLFGDMRGSKAKGQVWNEGMIELKNGVVIQAFGWEQEVRGWKHHDRRPDRCYLDDIETEERVRDMGAVDATMNKLYKQVLPAMDKKLRKIRVTGTPLADDCMVNRLKSKSHWTYFEFPICNGDPDDPKTVSNWESRYPMPWIRAERDRYAEMGLLSAFNQEYMLVAAQTVGKPFKEEYLVFEDVAPPVFMRRACLLDPARTTDVKNAESGHVEVGQLGSRFYVFESGGDSWQPSEQVDWIFDSSHRNEDCKVCVEADGLNDWLMEPVRKQSILRGNAVEIKAIFAPKDRDKVDFITGLQPYFKAGSIVFVGGRARHGKLVQQILNFPSGKKDVINALAFIQKAFAGRPVYPEFSAVNVLTDTVSGRNDQLALAVNADSRETVAALVSVSGVSKIVINDWASSMGPSDALRDIVALIKMLYPGKSLKVFIPAEVWDQQDRLPLLPAVRMMDLAPFRGGYASQCRGSLSLDIRTEWKGRRMFCVDRRATYTMNALSGDYAMQFERDGRQAGAPEVGTSRLIMEAIECLASALSSVQNASELPKDMPRGLTKGGTPYLTAMPRR